MKQRFILFRRGGVYYSEDTTTRKQHSLRTKDETEAQTLLNAKNESFRQPVLNLQIARAYLTASAPAFVDAPATDEDADLSLCRFTKRPVNRHALPDLGDEFGGDHLQLVAPHGLHGALVGREGIVKGDFVVV